MLIEHGRAWASSTAAGHEVETRFRRALELGGHRQWLEGWAWARLPTAADANENLTHYQQFLVKLLTECITSLSLALNVRN